MTDSVHPFIKVRRIYTKHDGQRVEDVLFAFYCDITIRCDVISFQCSFNVGLLPLKTGLWSQTLRSRHSSLAFRLPLGNSAILCVQDLFLKVAVTVKAKDFESA